MREAEEKNRKIVVASFTLDSLSPNFFILLCFCGVVIEMHCVLVTLLFHPGTFKIVCKGLIHLLE